MLVNVPSKAAALELLVAVLDAGVEEAISLAATELTAGVDDAGVDEAGVDEAGVDDAGLDDAGVLDAAGALELTATDELLLDFFLLSLPPQAVSAAAITTTNGTYLSIFKTPG